MLTKYSNEEIISNYLKAWEAKFLNKCASCKKPEDLNATKELMQIWQHILPFIGLLIT